MLTEVEDQLDENSESFNVFTFILRYFSLLLNNSHISYRLMNIDQTTRMGRTRKFCSVDGEGPDKSLYSLTSSKVENEGSWRHDENIR